jgi:S1-C subfamily serine protease
MQQTSQTSQSFTPPANWPSFHSTESDFRRYFDENLSNLDPIEGIWNVSDKLNFREINTGKTQNVSRDNYSRIAIIKDNSFQNYDYTAIVLETKNPNWKPKRVKGYFRKTSHHTIYEALWFKGDYKELKDNFYFNESGFIESSFTEIIPGRGAGPVEMTVNAFFIRAYPYLGSAVASKTYNDTIATGTGFVLASSGLIVTNYHVVENTKRIEVILPKSKVVLESKIRIRDSQNDIAILGIEKLPPQSIFKRTIPFNIVDTIDVKIGQTVFTLGFPLREIMGSTPRLSTGRINSRLGIQDDPRLFQISNPLQPGNSGGPLFNEKGELIGIVVSSLNAKLLYEQTGTIPQNVNFAIKSDYLKNLISMLPNADEILKRKNSVISGPLENLIEQLRPYVVQIRAY